MPTINVNRDELFQRLGQKFSDDDFGELCFNYGLELDEVTTEKQMISKEQGIDKADASEEVIYRIEVPANRYDLLCIEGLARGLLIFLNKMPVPAYKSVPGSHKVLVKKSTQVVRPFAVAAILRDITFTPEVYRSFIDLQEKLHQNLGRMRTLVSIGTHDLDTIKGPFTYDALPPKDISFVALFQTKKYSAPELMELYSHDTHLRPYLSIIKDSPVYPVYFDSNKTVMCFPPIINSEHSKITLTTKNVFIEITATDKYKASVALDTLVTMFGEYTKDKFVAESVEVVYEADGTREVYPQLLTFVQKVDPKYVNRALGTTLKEDEMIRLMSKMGLSGKLSGSLIEVTVPPTRQDILHPCDIVEDVGIAFGYNKINNVVPDVATIGSQLTINKVCDAVRFEIARCGFTEALTFALCSHDDLEHLHQPKDSLVTIANPKTMDFQVGRSTLLAGLLKTINANKKMPLPIKIFEVADVILRDSSSEVGARNERRLAAVYLSKTPGFEHIHGLLDRVMHVIDIPFGSKGYQIQAGKDAAFFEGRCAIITVEGKRVGVMGVLHPTVTSNFELNLPASAFEINMEALISTHLKNN